MVKLIFYLARLPAAPRPNMQSSRVVVRHFDEASRPSKEAFDDAPPIPLRSAYEIAQWSSLRRDNGYLRVYVVGRMCILQ
jgi:hypothetical protein